MATIRTAAERAREIGAEDRETYTDEFGTAPVAGEVGDWDANGVGEMVLLLSREGLYDNDDPGRDDLYQEVRVAYLEALFDAPGEID